MAFPSDVRVAPPLVPDKGSGRDSSRWRRISATGLVLTGLLIVVGWLVFIPLAGLVFTAFSEDTAFGPGAFTFANFVNAFDTHGTALMLSNTLITAMGAAILSLLFGGGLAFVVERTDAPGRHIFHVLALLSFAIPGLLATMAWMLVFSPNIGWANAVLRNAFGLTKPIFDIYSITGMIWALATHYFTLAYFLMGSAFRATDSSMEEAAVVFGAGHWQVAGRITLPLLRPTILSALLLLFVRGIETFEVPRLIGLPAHIHVFTTEIQNATSSLPPEFGLAAALGIGLLAMCVIGVYLYSRIKVPAQRRSGVKASGRPLRLGRKRWLVTLVTSLLFVICLGLPLFTLLWQSFFVNVTPPSLDTAGFTFGNYSEIIQYPLFREAVADSSLLGALAATIVVIMTFMLAWLAQRSAKRYAWLIDAFAFTPIAIPSVVIGATILFTYLLVPVPVYNTIWILLIAYVTMYMPLGMRFASSAISQINSELEEVAAVAGAGTLQIVRRVLLPLLAPALMAAWLYIFMLGVRDVGASIFLAGPDTPVLGTLSLTMWEEGGSYGAVSALGIIQIVPLVIIATLMRWFEYRVTRQNP